MDEDTAIINKNTRNEKIKNFFVKNTKKINNYLYFDTIFSFLDIFFIKI